MEEGKRPHIRHSDEIKQIAVNRWKEGHSLGEIASILEVPKGTVQLWVKNFKDRGKVICFLQFLCNFSYNF